MSRILTIVTIFTVFSLLVLSELHASENVVNVDHNCSSMDDFK